MEGEEILVFLGIKENYNAFNGYLIYIYPLWIH